MSWELWFAFVLASTAMLAIPGPTVMLVVSYALGRGKQTGWATVPGVTLGDFTAMTISLLGAGAVLAASATLFTVLKLAGAAYLIWLGFSLMFSKKKSAVSTKTAAPKHSASFVVGLITTLANPKAILFYLSFFPAFIDLAALSAIDILFVYLIAALAIGGVMFAYAVIAFKAKAKVANSRQSQLLRIGSGSLLIGSGAMLALKN